MHDGLTLAVQLRVRLGVQFPIFVLSGHAGAEYRRRANEIGVNAYFVKPAEPATIEAALETV